jgi:hypothetical protein
VRQRTEFSDDTRSVLPFNLAWSTGGSTATSTETLPVDRPRRDNDVISVQENSSAPTITSSTSQRIRAGIARIIRAGSPSNLRS